MANSVAERLSFSEVRESVKRVQDEGERLVGRLRGESEKLVGRVRGEVVRIRDESEKLVDRVRDETRTWVEDRMSEPLDQVRRQAGRVRRDLETRRDEVVDALRARLRTVADALVKTLRVADVDRVAALSREVTGLGLRIADLERKLQSLSKQLKQEKKKEQAA